MHRLQLYYSVYLIALDQLLVITMLFSKINNFVNFSHPFMGSAILEETDYYPIILEHSQIVGNKDLHILFSKQYNIMDRVDFFHYWEDFICNFIHQVLEWPFNMWHVANTSHY